MPNPAILALRSSASLDVLTCTGEDATQYGDGVLGSGQACRLIGWRCKAPAMAAHAALASHASTDQEKSSYWPTQPVYPAESTGMGTVLVLPGRGRQGGWKAGQGAFWNDRSAGGDKQGQGGACTWERTRMGSSPAWG